MGLRVLAGVVTLLALAAPPHAFDTGPHHDMTCDAMTAEGFSPAAGAAAAVDNWRRFAVCGGLRVAATLKSS